MARTARLIIDNLLLATDAVRTASSEQFGKPVSNLSSPLPWQNWASASSATDEWVKFDLGVAKNFQSVQLVKFVGHTGGSIRFQANATDVWTSPSVNQVITVPSPNYTRTAGVWFSTVQSYRWIRILFQNTGAVTQQVSLGVAVLGTYFQPAISLAPYYGITRKDPSSVSRVPGGQKVTFRRQQYFEIRGSFDKEPETERAGFMSAFNTIGTHTPFIFAINPDDQGYFVFYGRFEDQLEFQHITVHRFGMPFMFSEDL